MKKSTLAKLLGVATYFLILSPFFLIPDDMVYVKKSQSVYQPYIQIIFSVSIVIIFISAIDGFVGLWNRILKNIKD